MEKEKRFPDNYYWEDWTIIDFLEHGLSTDGAHHKQFFLYKIAERIGMDYINHKDKGIAP